MAAPSKDNLKVIHVVLGIALVVIGAGISSLRPSPPALAPGAPRSRCADVRTALDAARGAAIDPDPLVVRSDRLGFECTRPDQMAGRFLCEGESFEATVLPECLPNAVDRVDVMSNVVVWPFRTGRVGVTQLCRGCELRGKGYVTKQDIRVTRIAGPVMMVLGIGILVAFVLLRSVGLKKADDPAAPRTP